MGEEEGGSGDGVMFVEMGGWKSVGSEVKCDKVVGWEVKWREEDETGVGAKVSCYVPYYLAISCRSHYILAKGHRQATRLLRCWVSLCFSYEVADVVESKRVRRDLEKCNLCSVFLHD